MLDFMYMVRDHEREQYIALGLSAPDAFKHNMWTPIGNTAEGIQVSVVALPARCFRFEFDSESGHCVVETGSGRIGDYMDAVRQIADDMIFVAYAPTTIDPTSHTGTDRALEGR